MLKGHQNIFVHFLQRLEVFRKLSEIFRSCWDKNRTCLTHRKYIFNEMQIRGGVFSS